jgi:hypothetical protein
MLSFFLAWAQAVSPLVHTCTSGHYTRAQTKMLLEPVEGGHIEEEVCFRLHEISSSLEEVVGRNWDIYRDEPGDLVDWADWSCSWMNDID